MACEQACTGLRGLGDTTGEASAQVAAANARLSQASGPQADEALVLARAALASFKGSGQRAGEAVALATAAAATTAKGDAREAENLLREALAIFRELRDSVGDAYAMLLLKEIKVVAARPCPATAELDLARGVAQIEVTDGACLMSLRGVVAKLQAAQGLACVVLHLAGATDPAAAAASSRDVGVFLLGLRTLGLPVIASICGRISGPMWGLVLCCDYRIAATSSTFICPLWGKPECFRSILGHNVSTQLTMAVGPKDSLVMLESGVLHQLQKGTADARTAATEMAKRVAATPSMACRKQPFILNQAVEDYAMAAVHGKGLN